MELNPVLIVAIVAAFIALALVSRGSRTRKVRDYPYVRSTSLFTPAERSFLGVLEQVAGNDYRVFGKVRLGDVVEVRRGLSNSQRQSARNRIDRKHLDFVVCDSNELSVLCAIELDDKSHSRPDRRERDQFLDKALEAAGVPIVRIPNKRIYTLEEVRAALSPALNVPAQGLRGMHSFHAPAENPAEMQRCPDCGAELVRRKARRGARAGKEFWGCTNYPSCKTIIPLE